MAKKNQKNGGGKNNPSVFRSLRASIHPETERSIAAILFISIAAILILASLHNAGPAGEFIYKILAKLFGLGYYLFPTILLVMAGALLFRKEQKNRGFAMAFLGASLFVIAGLGLIDIIYPDKGGLLGKWAGSLENFFGYVSSIIIAGATILIAFLITLNVPLKLMRRAEDSDEEAPIIIQNPAMFPSSQTETDPTADDKNSKQVKDKTQSIKENLPEVRVAESKTFLPSRKKIFAKIENYTPPPLDLLKSTIEKPTAGDLRANANIIKRTLDSFGIPVEMGEISIGPKVTRYTLKPAEGIKLSRITALNQDIALALAAHPIRIEAPIPGKSLVGIEVPNKSAAVVRLGSLMTYPDFTNSGPLTFVLGRDVSGEPIVTDIDKMPHLLIAGSTGSGKSVGIHSLLVSLLYKNSPESLKLILVDPKRVELTIYNGIPHLVTPVIIEGKKAVGVFRWAIDEMERRYEKLQAAGARDIKSFNDSNASDALPYILILVDELADLMTSYGRAIESSIVRLAQMARATGIHLILSTQRPSVEVITGLIKANITSRIALQVASQVDSRTILDMSGAEKLLGGGDMLFISPALSKPKRIQGAYISEEELRKVTDFIREHNTIPKTEENKEANAPLSNFESGPKEEIDFDHYAKETDDELYEEAVRVVQEAKKASASLLQRRLAVGYARAARLLDIMEERGIVGPGEGAKPREVYETDANL